MPRALVAMGANLGDPESALCRAAQALRALADGDFAAASLWRSDPADCPPGSPRFVNSAVALETRLSSIELLDSLQALEHQAGRRRSVPNAPRELDLDLVDYDGARLSSPRLTLPHPRAAERDFVLVPLAELVPDYVLPGSTASVRVLSERVGSHNLERLGPM